MNKEIKYTYTLTQLQQIKQLVAQIEAPLSEKNILAVGTIFQIMESGVKFEEEGE